MMPKQKNTFIAHVICWLLLCILCLTVHAQKLPSIQQTGLRAPSKAKADGKLTEWGQLQAHNPSTGLSYTIANNDEFLFVAIQAKDPADISKILVGNVTFSISQVSSKMDKECMSVAFPFIKGILGTSIGLKVSEPITATDAAGQARQTDSLVRLLNEDMGNKFKEIQIIGFKQLPDTLLSVYNEEGIKVAGAFDQNRAMVFELAIPLKHLGLSVKQNARFFYNIKLHGLDNRNVVRYGDNSAHPGVTVIGYPTGLNPGRNFEAFINSTDLSGEYTLVE